jgi:Cu-Zn family superoxide dismutase
MQRLLTLSLCLALCATPMAPALSAAQKARAIAKVAGLDGKPLGQIYFRATSHGVLMEINLKGLPPGLHALHIHAAGRCDAKTKFASAGNDFSSDAKKLHGYFAKGGSHAGDLPNQTVAADGTMRVSLISNLFSLGTGKKSIFDKDGASFVVHVKGDDYMSQPAGNSGERLACGVIERIDGGKPKAPAKAKPVQASRAVNKRT